MFARLNGIFAREMVSPVVALKAGHKFPSITHSVGKDQVQFMWANSLNAQKHSRDVQEISSHVVVAVRQEVCGKSLPRASPW